MFKIDFNKVFEDFENELVQIKNDISQIKIELVKLNTNSTYPPQKYFNTSEVANILNVTNQTVRNYVFKGKLSCLKLKGIKELKFTQSHIDDFVKHFFLKNNSGKINEDVKTSLYKNSKLKF